ncbi:hypothetical protein GCM10027343_02770 [Noviherbaspirillum agri]
MNSNMKRGTDTKQGKDDGVLEKIANTIDPSGQDVSDEELSDPGANIRDETPKRERIERKPPDTH